MFDILLPLLLLSTAGSATAAVRYVDLTSTSPAPPYNSWATAATTIQAAVDAADAGDEIVVTNGVYATGGRTVLTYLLTNRVAVTKPLAVRSVNGPEVTIIEGHQVPGTTNGDAAVRCVYLTNGASLIGFTLTNGATRSTGNSTHERSGGGLWCPSSTTALASNCVMAGNAAHNAGGGVYVGGLTRCRLTGNQAFGQSGGVFSGRLTNCVLTGNGTGGNGGGAGSGTLVNCLLQDNSAAGSGGGASSATLYNCTLTGNSAASGGGVRSGTLFNCLVYFNTAATDPNHSVSTLNSCDTTPLPSSGTNNLALDPQLASASHLSAGSPCRGAGNPAFATGTDLDGEAWLSAPAIGCDEFYAGAVTGALSVDLATSLPTVAVGFPVNLTALIEGRPNASVWEFGDGLMASNQPWTSHVWTSPGDYAVVLRAYNDANPGGVSATGMVHVVPPPVHHVAAGNVNPVSPFSSWATAAPTIQEAVDAATIHGAVVQVSNGVYATGGRAVYGTLVNRVAVTMPLVLRSVNGSDVTVIQGAFAPGTNWGDGAIRCVYLTNGASLSGFTLTSGATRATGDTREQYGGGAWCEAAATPISNCVFAGNAAFRHGGGAYRGTLSDCTLSNNVAGLGGGAAAGTLDRCTVKSNRASFGGGAYMAALSACVVSGNTAIGGGAADSSTLNDCLVTANTADEGGGTWDCSVTNCTLVGNSATGTGGGGGALYGRLCNSILYFNTATNGPNYWGLGTHLELNYCCTTPLPTNGVGNITDAPLFVDFTGGNLRLQAGSPGIDAGLNAAAAGALDLDGNPRIVGGTVDLGAYEWFSTSPRLYAVRSNAVVLVTWPKADADWALEFTTTLAATGASARTLIPPPYPTNATECVVTEPAPVGNKFYRLRKP